MEKKAKVPKLRFPGFAGDWEERKLGDIAEIKDSARIPNSLWEENGVPYLRSSDLANKGLKGELFISAKSYSKYKKKTGAPCSGDVLFTSGGQIGLAFFKADDNPVYVQGGAVLYVKTSTSELLDGLYLKTYFESPIMVDYMFSAAAGGTIQHFTLKPAKSSPISFPISMKEQQKIGEFFKSIDNLITLHQCKLTHLQVKKKSLLQKMFPKKGERVPEIRFPGFTDDWEQRKLGQVAKFSKGNGYSKDDLIDQGTPIILYGRMYTKYQTQINEVDDTFADKRANAVYSTGKEVIVPASGETAEDISVASAVMQPGILLGGDLNIVYPQEKLNSVFLALQMSNGNAKQEMSRRAQGKSIVHLHNTDLKEAEVVIPNLDEQKKITNFFNTLDNLITLHQCKLTHLQTQKKALLQQMFV